MKINTDEQMYRQIVESSAETIIIQQDGKFMYINPAGVTFLQAASKEEVIGKPIFDIIPEEYKNLVIRHTNPSLKKISQPE